MVIISPPAVDDADSLAAAADASRAPNYAASTADTSSSAYHASTSFQSYGDDLACYAGHTLFLQPPVPRLHMQPPSTAELSYLYFPQLPFEPSTIRPELQLPTTMMPPASEPPPLYYPQTQGTATAPALAEQAQEGVTRPAPRRRGRPSNCALLAVPEPPPVSKPTKRVAVGSNRAAAASSSQMASSAVTSTATMSSAAGQQVPEQAGGSSSSTGSTSDQQTAACTSQLHGAPAPAAGVVVEGHHQQDAIAPPELTTAAGPQYADTSPVGVRFHPTDQELIGYLRRKYDRQQMPVKFFKDFDVYQAHPMAIKGACGESQNGCWYAFSPRDRKYRNGKRPARSVFAEGGGGHQVGFWKSNSKLGNVHAGGKKDGAVIGRMTSLTFQLGRQPRGKQTGWKMKEYTIPENQHQPDGSAMLLNDWVVCKLFYKERAGCTKTESKADENAVGQERPMRGKSEEDKNPVSVGHKRPKRSTTSEKDKNDIPPEDGPPGDAAGENVKGEEDMQQMVPADHQASNYSEQDVCVEDYLVCDVAFAQQNDAANCTI